VRVIEPAYLYLPREDWGKFRRGRFQARFTCKRVRGITRFSAGREREDIGFPMLKRTTQSGRRLELIWTAAEADKKTQPHLQAMSVGSDTKGNDSARG